jgi:hypothetical protein
MTDTPTEQLRMHLAQAKTRADDPDAQAHLARCLELVDLLPPTPLDQCSACGRVGPRPLVCDSARHDCG